MGKEYVIKTNKDGSKITVAQVHEQLLDIMKEIDRICRKYEIPYYLTGGSCLGAVRHNGFIPWDDDMDLGMMYDDYVRFVEACKKELPNEHYYFQCFDTHKEYNVLIPAMKFRKRGTLIKEANTLLKNKCKDGEGIFVDVFVVDYISEKKWIDFSARMVTYLMMPFIVLFENIGMNPLFLKKIFMKFVRYYGKKNKNSSFIGYDLCWLYNNPLHPVVYRKDEIFPLQYHVFEDSEFLIPKNPKELLDVEVSVNHMSYPPEKMQQPKHIVDIKFDSEE